MLLSRTLKRLSKQYVNRLINQVPEIKSDSMADILLTLADNQRALTQRELCIQLDLDKSRIALMIVELSSIGHVSVSVNLADRREHLVSLTSTGYDLVIQLKKAVAHINQELRLNNPALSELHV